MTVTHNSDRIEVVFGRRYTTKILMALLDQGQPMRFTEIFYAVPGLSKRLLTERLTELEGTGMVVRDVRTGKPVTITYRLSEAGTGLQAALSEIRRWADQQPA